MLITDSHAPYGFSEVDKRPTSEQCITCSLIVRFRTAVNGFIVTYPDNSLNTITSWSIPLHSIPEGFPKLCPVLSRSDNLALVPNLKLRNDIINNANIIRICPAIIMQITTPTSSGFRFGPRPQCVFALYQDCYSHFCILDSEVSPGPAGPESPGTVIISKSIPSSVPSLFFT